MTNTLTVRTAQNTYPIHIEADFSKLADCFAQAGLNRRKVCVVTDSNVSGLYAAAVTGALSGVSGGVRRFTFEAGEQSKNLDTIAGLYRFCLEQRLDRTSVIAALGGGVAGDMAGFAAATYMRGITFVQIPTTLLAQADSSVGGKTGVDFEEQKNVVGAFYQPAFVYSNVGTLQTLPPADFSSGMAEAIKHGLIGDTDYLEFIRANKTALKALDAGALKKLVHGSCRLKAGVVSQDEKESGLREILNFGHTFGHAIESLSGFSMPHGHCVAVGATAALYLSAKMGKISERDVEDARALFAFFDLPAGGVSFGARDILARMRLDKKARDNQLRLVLLEKIGRAAVIGGASDEDVLWAILKVKGL